jgi:hypothetical protein
MMDFRSGSGTKKEHFTVKSTADKGDQPAILHDGLVLAASCRRPHDPDKIEVRVFDRFRIGSKRSAPHHERRRTYATAGIDLHRRANAEQRHTGRGFAASAAARKAARRR